MKHLTIRLIAAAALSLISAAVFAAEQPSPYQGPWPGWHGYWPGFWWICPLMMLVMLVFFMVVFFAMRRGRGGWPAPWRGMSERPEDLQAREGPREVTPESALDILNRRYALGEIDKEEYEDKKAAIVSSNK